MERIRIMGRILCVLFGRYQLNVESQNSSSNAPFVVVVVLTWNDTELTTSCLTSVLESDYPNLQVVLVDNGSNPPVGESLRNVFPQVQLVQNTKNQGFSGGANRGLEKALEHAPEYIHFLGNDATLAPDTISKLVSACEDDHRIGVAGPLLLDPGPEKIVQFYTASLDRGRTAHTHHRRFERYSPENFPTTDCDFIPCVAPFFRAMALREVGLFDESLGTCWEDYDLCIRFHDAGWKYVAVGSATATHVGSYTTGRVSPYIVYHATRNRLICMSRYAGRFAWIKHFPYYVRSQWFQMNQYGLTNWECHSAYFRGIRDYFRRVRGESSGSHSGHAPGSA